MLRDGDGEKEILLGNKQLLGIFFLVVILLGIAFGGGYKLGQGTRKSTATDETAATTSTATGGAETRTVGADSSTATSTEAPAPQTGTETPLETAPSSTTAADTATEPPLGSRSKPKTKPAAPPVDAEAAGPPPAPVTSHGAYSPQPGQTFLQVAAVSRDEADGIADVLRRKGFRAHSVPKPGSKLYRVIIGPVRDASDLNTTRNSLRSTGFREIFVQRY